MIAAFSSAIRAPAVPAAAAAAPALAALLLSHAQASSLLRESVGSAVNNSRSWPRSSGTHGSMLPTSLGSSLRSAAAFSTAGAAGTVDVVLALGGNEGGLGAVAERMRVALAKLRQMEVEVVRQSHLYRSVAWGVTDQPDFLNSAVYVRTQLSPADLFARCKAIEAAAGRDLGPDAPRWGPRPLDLDIIAYGDYEGTTSDEGAGDGLTIPHAHWRERAFVKAPVADLYTTRDAQWKTLREMWETWQKEGGETGLVKDAGLTRVFRIPSACGQSSTMHEFGRRTWIMGILNTTPDSFSDGELYENSDDALYHACSMAENGADIIDIGGQSTRPGADRVGESEEMARVVPVIRKMRAHRALADKLISVDTYSAAVAEAAVQAGANIINDVSGGTLDPDMFPVVAKTGVPYILMHMRGDPKTMQREENVTYDDCVAEEVRAELCERAEAAMAAGVAAWQLIIDPGVGFAKDHAGSTALIRNLPKLREDGPVGMLAGAPMLVGPSRKSFIGALTGRKDAADRDWGTAAACTACVAGGADIVRVHNVRGIRDAIAVADGVYRRH